MTDTRNLLPFKARKVLFHFHLIIFTKSRSIMISNEKSRRLFNLAWFLEKIIKRFRPFVFAMNANKYYSNKKKTLRYVWNCTLSTMSRRKNHSRNGIMFNAIQKRTHSKYVLKGAQPKKTEEKKTKTFSACLRANLTSEMALNAHNDDPWANKEKKTTEQET
jgi:hypothetical protein